MIPAPNVLGRKYELAGRYFTYGAATWRKKACPGFLTAVVYVIIV